MLRPDGLAGKTVGKYKVIRLIGRGGMAHVYLAQDTTLSRNVALKVLDAARAADQRFVARFQREARTAAQLKHPNIVIIFEVGETEGLYYIAMEYLQGQTLKDILTEAHESNQMLDLDYVITILQQIAEALTYAYQMETIVHRDVKPANMVVDQTGHVTLTDFGIARALEDESDLTSDSGFIGTPLYMSPEHIEGGAIDHRSDIYSLGVVLYQMLAGGGPFGGTTTSSAIMYKHVHAHPISPRKLNRRVNPKVEQVVLKALEKNPNRRFQSADEMAQALVDAYQYSGLMIALPGWVVPAVIASLVIWVGIALTLHFKVSVDDVEALLVTMLTQPTVSSQATPTPGSIIVTYADTPNSLTVFSASELHLRTGPGQAYDELGVVGAGTPLEIKAKNGDATWVKVETPDASIGWVPVAELEISQADLAGVPGAVVPPTPTFTPEPTATPPPAPKEEQSTAIVILVTSTPTVTPTSTDTPTPTPTSTPRPVIPPTATPTETSTPTPPPIRGRLAFPMDDGSGHYDIWMVYLPDGKPFLAVEGARQPCLHKGDGRLLANGEDNPSGLNNILVASANLDRVWMASDAPDDEQPFWDPNGTRFVFGNPSLTQGRSGNYFLYVQCTLKRPSEEQDPDCQDIATTGILYAGTGGDVLGEYPVWVDDGTHRIVYRGAGGISPYGGMYLIGSWATVRDGGGQRPVLFLPGQSGRPTDAYGERIAFFSTDLDDNWEAYTIKLDSSNLVNLSNSPHSSDGLPTFSPDGRWVAFVSDRDGNWGIWVAPVTGGTQRKLLDFPKSNPWGAGEHDWTTERISWGP